MSNRYVSWGVLLVSLAILMLELILTRIFSVTMYYHFAFLAISLALFGSGASGIAIYIFPQYFTLDKIGQRLTLAAISCAVSVIIALTVLLQINLDVSLSSSTFYQDIFKLTLLYLISVCPFFWGGLCISLALSQYAATASKLYFFDLIGASVGCLLVIPALNFFGGPTSMLIISVPLLLAALLFSRLNATNWTVPTAILLLASLGLVTFDYFTQTFSITNAKGEQAKAITFQKWNSFSRITVLGNPETDSYLQIKIDSDAATAVSRFRGRRPQRPAHPDISSLAYYLKQDAAPEVLIIGPGGGPDVLHALSFNARHVTGAEINPLIVNEIMRNRFREFSGNLYTSHPDVTIAVDEGRSYIRSTKQQFDVIQATLVDTWAATSAGAFALTENNLYTVEAFKDYFTHLTPQGVLTMTRWLLQPPQQDLRLISLTRATMAELGVANPEKHIMMIKDHEQGERVAVTFLLKRTPFLPDEVARMQELCQKEQFGILYLPGHPQDNIFTKLITTPDPQTIYQSYPLNISPTYDNSPFFFNNIRLFDSRRGFRLDYESRKTNLGMFVLMVLFIITSILVSVGLLGPLLLLRRDVLQTQPAASLRLVGYFACLGLGFITIEIALVQKFTLFLGHPVYSLAVILFSLLLFSSLGSYFSARFNDLGLRSHIQKIVILLAIVVISYIFVLPFFFYNYVSLPLVIKIALAIFFLIPLALLMGMPMPLGLRLANREAKALIPWAWGINGATSVLGSVTTFLLAISWGFNQALVVGLIIYGLALLLLGRRALTVAKA
jgi:hypothetical protein